MGNKHEEKLTGVLRGRTAPTQIQKQRFCGFLQKAYGTETELLWKKDETIAQGFILTVGNDVYDWSGEDRSHKSAQLQMHTYDGGAAVLPITRGKFATWEYHMDEERGYVLTTGNGVATVVGIPYALCGEILLFENGICGIVRFTGRNQLGCILLGNDATVAAGSVVHRSGKMAGVPVGEDFLGHVVNALGEPIDGSDRIVESNCFPLEPNAPDVKSRKPIDRPMETGIMAIDAMFPIGRGQCALLIGDRHTGKTSVAIDAILNQKTRGVVCIYVSVGQRAEDVECIAALLREHGAMEYTVIVSAAAGESSSMQYLAPFVGCTMGEYFANLGMDVLIVYDDLCKHVAAYRALRLLLGCAPGNEGCSADMFRLHEPLIERTVQLSTVRGGGSLTTLAVVETQGGDVTACVPANLISLSDGQIYMESSLFSRKNYPAVNIDKSVSRSGGTVQSEAMRRVAGVLRSDLLQHGTSNLYAQFTSELDALTRRRIAGGQRLQRLLLQTRGEPLRRYEQVVTLLGAESRVFLDCPIDKVVAMRKLLTEGTMERCPELCAAIEKNGVLSGEEEKQLLAVARELTGILSVDEEEWY